MTSFKTRGKKGSPDDVGQGLLEVFGVRETAVVGMRNANAILGQLVAAMAAVDSGQANERCLKKAGQERLENFMMPQRIFNCPKRPTARSTDSG